MLRAPLASERITMIDPTTGIKVVQLTSYPVPSWNLLYNWPSVTPDNRRVVFTSQRYAGRTAPWDVWRCDTDGLNLFQLTDRGDEPQTLPPTAALGPDGESVYSVWHHDCVFCRIDLETGRLEELCDLMPLRGSERASFGYMAFSPSGRHAFLARFAVPVSSGCVKIDLATGVADTIDLGGLFTGCDQARGRLAFMASPQDVGVIERPDGTRMLGRTDPASSDMWTTDEEGGDPRFLCPNLFAHYAFVGKTSAMQGCGRPPERCIWFCEEGKDPEKLVQGPYFWHSGPSFDGEWIVADTNWPDMGLQLVHVPTRHFRTLCHPRASLGHPQEGHPHPSLSRDGRVAVFGSDRTGVRQVYVAYVTDEFRESVKAGELDNPRDKWI